MPIPLPTLDGVASLGIPTPCTVPWGEMSGDEKSRFCGQCRRPVFDLTAMTTTEAAELLANPDGRPCVRLYQRSDARVLTADCTVGVRARVWRGLRRRAAWAASLFAMLLLPACRTATQGLPANAHAGEVGKLPPADSTGGVPLVVSADNGTEALAGQPSPKNAITELAGNKFIPWQTTRHYDFPLWRDRLEVAPHPRRIEQ